MYAKGGIVNNMMLLSWENAPGSSVYLLFADAFLLRSVKKDTFFFSWQQERRRYRPN